MNSQPSLPKAASSPPTPAHRTGLKLAFGLLAGLLLAIMISLVLVGRNDRALIWLTPAEFTRITDRGPFTRMKYKLLNLTAPIWQRFRRAKPTISVDSSLMTLPKEAVALFDLGPSAATNSSGLRAWILSREQVKKLRLNFKRLPGEWFLNEPRLTTASGMQAQAQMFSGESIVVAGRTTPVGLTINLNPKVASGSIQLRLLVTFTKLKPATADNPVACRTNFAASCQALVPNGGGLLLDGGNAKDTNREDYWFLVSPTAVDARGKPVEL